MTGRRYPALIIAGTNLLISFLRVFSTFELLYFLLYFLPPCISLLFLLLRDVDRGGLGFEGVWLCRLPKGLYRNHLTAILGFPPADFFSTDYFPLLSWLFLFLTGYFLYRLRPEREPSNLRLPVVTALGRHSLVAYLLHQPMIYGLLWLLFSA